jgi:signal transduction histidine kinase
MKVKIILLVFVVLVVCSLLSTQELERTKLIPAFIYNFAKNIEWQEESGFVEFNFVIVTKDMKLANEFKNIDLELRGKSINMLSTTNLENLKNAHLIFLAADQTLQYEQIFDAIEGKNTLLVSVNYSDQKIVMINLVDTDDSKLNFEINKANILNQGLKILPDMVLMGGSEIDVAELYRESQQSLRGMQKEVDRLMLNEMELEKQIAQRSAELEQQNIVIEKQFAAIDSQKIQIEWQKSISSKLIAGIALDKETLEKQELILTQQKVELLKQNESIQSGEAILNEQKYKIELQAENITNQMKTLEQQKNKLFSQKQTIFSLIIIIVLTLGLILTIYRSYLKNKKANKLISEQKAKLEVTLLQLKNANKELEAFAYSVSHDLRAPLRAINGFTRVLMEDYVDKLDEEGKRLGAIIEHNAKKMGQLIDDLLHFSRIVRSELHHSKIDMKNMVRAIYHEATNEAERKRISFSIADLPDAYGDPNMFRLVWMNLISNAVKFSSQLKEAVISVTSKNEKGRTIYCIKDNGAGFNMKYKDKLFGVFQRLHSENEFEGTGVGLAIVQRIISRHEGDVWAEGKVDKGSEFYFSLPNN